MTALDPLADIELCLRCPACGHAWLLGFDATVFLWSRVDETARNVLYEVHQLSGPTAGPKRRFWR